ncbi:hypothetical protein JOC86_000249 [Bacillus pakistanensis]|uniref:Uncharacterized protein n=1 Tax=Rossellomorea pakistanensis TaxID=992288 RepID=A0ABS2N779_9BACI|nr:hypothetical protein [Bacillus pakistanensis]MBM7583712.1 hypothetical protein [Bacillus pakistanensis]
MKAIFNGLVLIGVLGSIGKYMGFEFLKENSLWFLIILVAGLVGRDIFARTGHRESNSTN